jgi:hypothetical protein
VTVVAVEDRQAPAESVPVRARARGILVLYVAAIAVAEAMVAVGSGLAAALVDGVVLFVIVSHLAWSRLGHERPESSGDDTRILLVLAILPVLRITSLGVPLAGLPPIYWHLVISAPVLVAAHVAAKEAGLAAATIGLRIPSWRQQAAIAVAGIPLGLGAYLVVRPGVPEYSPGFGGALLAVISLTVFAAATEELVFRGLVQTVFDGVLRCPGVLWSTLLFTLFYVSSRDAGYVGYIGVVGLLFGWWARRTGSIVGVWVAHAYLLSGLVLVWPHVLT